MFGRLRLLIKGTFYLIVITALLACLFLMALPNISYLRDHNPQTTRFMEIYLEEISSKGEEPVLDREWIPLSLISSHLKRAVLISEDDAFYQHQGFDFRQIRESLVRNWRDKAFTRGGSTITQQLVKNLYLAPQKNIFRKIREWILTYQMEKTLTKDRILEVYLNVIEWGPGVYGAEAAARYYFGTSARRLSIPQSAYLAAILPHPRLYGTSRYERRALSRANLIRRRMGREPLRKETNPTEEWKTIPSGEGLQPIPPDGVPHFSEEGSSPGEEEPPPLLDY